MRRSTPDRPLVFPKLGEASRFDAGAARELARVLYGLDVTARVLPSERDQNFVLESGAGEQYVLKVANAREERVFLDAQHGALAKLGAKLSVVPRVVRAKNGANMVEVAGPDGRHHFVWVITWLPGVTLGTVSYRSPALLEDFGRTVGALGRELQGFDHPAIHRDFYWDLALGRRIVSEHRAELRDDEFGTAIDVLLQEFDRHTAPLLPRLRRSAVHNDLNDYNVLVGGGSDLETRDQRVTGIVDFGDMVYSYTVGDLAIAIAYAVLDAPDPLAVAAQLVRGYHAEFPLTDDDFGALFGLAGLRLCTSACIAVSQRREKPDNAYLAISQEAIRRALPRLATPFRFAEAVFREACGLEPAPSSARVVTWLRKKQSSFAPVLDTDLRSAPCTVLDLGVTSGMIEGDGGGISEPRLTARVFDAMREAGVAVSIGRYDEPRLLYATNAFATGDRVTDERRMLHIGLDLFAKAGTPVHAFLEGIVHAFADNDALQDYGPVIILRHTTEDGTDFFTLYGHLSRESLESLRVGQRVAKGQRIATLGTAAVNGGWTPHLHLQLITDLLDLDCDFPGVARVSQRAVWRSLCPDPNVIVGIPAERFPPAPPTRAETLASRGRLIGHNLSVSYREPVKVVRGWSQYLFDESGRRYLDAYNNVAHVGHCHPRVVQAGAAQMALLNTNTRYPSDLLNEYSARLSATLPEPLGVCFIVNSASEANELALRLARAHTKQRDMIVLEHAYHGNTTALIDLSPYKHAGPGGCGAPEWVHVAPIPDDYRGRYKRGDAEAGSKYAEHVEELIERLPMKGRGLAGFIAETCPSVGGQVIFPSGYLAEAYRHVREAGGVCIADEVQTGLGRMGTHCWAFEAQGVVPDIVVMGKPLGNGHPIAAVVTTADIAASFDNGMEFFSTFGGNNVSCAIGLAVLDVVRDEKLQSHALEVGERLLAGLRPLAEKFPLVGDVRGSGLFLGVELVRDRETLEPAGEEAAFVANRMRERGILLGTDGPHHNVVKIRPPMPLSGANAELLVETLGEVLRIVPASR